MSDLEFPELPGWRFTVEEVSNGVYRARGVDSLGRSVETTRDDDTAAIEWCRRAAVEIVERGPSKS
jgi:hypothetical protein